MSFNEENIARFDQYFEGEMSSIVRKELEQELIEDQTLKSEFDAYSRFISELSSAEITAFTEQLKKWDQAAEPPQKKDQIFSLRFLVAAAAVIVGVVIASSYFFNSPSHEELIVANFEPYPNVVTVRGAAEEIDKGLLFYDQKKYPEAIEIFETYPENQTAQFYAGEANMALESYGAAAASYERLLMTESIFNEIASFHLGLAYLGMDKTDDAKVILSSIALNSDYYVLAQALLGDLK